MTKWKKKKVAIHARLLSQSPFRFNENSNLGVNPTTSPYSKTIVLPFTISAPSLPPLPRCSSRQQRPPLSSSSLSLPHVVRLSLIATSVCGFIFIFEMDDISTDIESLLAHIQRLENEKNDLRKYVEELCTQQAGPRYLHVANGMHFQKTAGLEQEVMKLRRELTECRRDQIKLKEELAEASQQNMKLSDLYKKVVEKNMEVQSQLKFSQEGIATAIAERDNAFTEAKIAKEKEYLLFQTLHECHARLEETKSNVMKAQEHVSSLQQVVDKSDQVKQKCLFDRELESGYVDKCSYLSHDPEETRSFNIHSEAALIHQMNALQEGCESLKSLTDDLKIKIQMDLDMESKLKRKVCDLQNKMKMLDEFIDNEISRLRQYYIDQRNAIGDLLDEGNSYLLLIFHELLQSLRPDCLDGKGLQSLQPNVRVPEESDREDMHLRFSSVVRREVSDLMRLQDLEERYRLEKRENAVLLGNMSELQSSFKQVTDEKLTALMKLEKLEQDLLLGETIHDGKAAKLPANDRDRAITSPVREGRFADILRRASFKPLIRAEDFAGSDSSFHSVGDRSFSSRRSSNNMDVLRMKIDIATLNEAFRSLEDLTSGIHKLRESLVKASEACMCSDTESDNLVRSIEHVINEANIVQTSLCSPSSSSRVSVGEGDSKLVKINSVTAAGFEMVTLLLLAAHTVKDKASDRRNRDNHFKKVQ